MKTIPLSFAIVLSSGLSAQEPSSPTLMPRGEGSRLATSFLGSTSEVLFDRPVADGPLWAMGGDWKASFDERGLEFVPFFGSTAPCDFPLRIEVARATVGGEALAISGGRPVAAKDAVRTERGAFAEVIRTGPHEIEQSFVFEALPNRGAVAVDVTISTVLTCSPLANGLLFQNEFGNVAYQKAEAVDAAGARVALPITWNGTAAHIEIPASFVEKARLPLVLDPVVNVNWGLAPAITQQQREPDVATIETPGRTCVVWRRQYSATDMDCWAVILDADLVPATATVAIDFTTSSWSAPAVASNTYAQEFLVVSQVDSGAAHWISGRMIDTAGTIGAQFDIERGGVVGLPGNKFRPDVGGDPYYGVAAYFTVVFEHEPTPGALHDVCFKQVNQDGTLRTTNPIALITSAGNIKPSPSISKSNRTQNWCVAWQSGVNEVRAAEIAWFGSIAVSHYHIAFATGLELLPHVSSPADMNGSRAFLIAFQYLASAGNNNIRCEVQLSGSGSVGSFDLSQWEAGGAYAGWDQTLPEADSDGIRFVVGYTEQWQGLYDHDTRVSTLSFSPTTLAWTIDDTRTLLNGSASEEYWTRMAADAGSGSSPSPRYKIVSAKFNSNDIQVFDYGGYSPGQLFTTRPMQCGTLSIAASGTPALGNPVTFTVANGALSGTIVGFPGAAPLGALGCNCTLGVANGFLALSPFSWTIPTDSAYIGMTVSVQGWTIAGSQCLGAIDFSDTIDFTIR